MRSARSGGTATAVAAETTGSGVTAFFGGVQGFDGDAATAGTPSTRESEAAQPEIHNPMNAKSPPERIRLFKGNHLDVRYTNYEFTRDFVERCPPKTRRRSDLHHLNN